MRFALNTVVWGSGYVDLLLNHSLPTLFSPGNLIDSPWTDQFVYQLMTTRADLALIQPSAIFRRLEQTVDVQVLLIDDIQVDETEATHKYNRVSLAQSMGIRHAVGSCDGFLALYPDFVYSKNALSAVVQRLAEGYRAVLNPIPFMSLEAVRDGLFRLHGMEIGTSVGREIHISPRRLVELNIMYPHPVNRGFEMDSGEHAEWPGIFTWPVPGQGQIMRSFHLHPTGIRLDANDEALFGHFEVSIDDEFVSRVLSIDDKLAFVTDSDDLAMCSLRGVNDPPQPMPGSRADLGRAARWAEEFSGLMLRYFTRQEFRWHYTDMTDPNWERRSKESEAFTRRLRKRLVVPDLLMQIEDPVGYDARRRRSRYFQHRNAAV